MAPGWLTIIAWLYLSICFVCAGAIAYDIALNHRHQQMGVMNFVFPITALYFGPLALALYWRWGRAAHTTTSPSSAAGIDVPVMAMTSVGDPIGEPATKAYRLAPALGPARGSESTHSIEVTRPNWVMLAIEVSHCGSGCTLGDVIAEFAIFALGLTIAGLTLPAEYIGDFTLALALGIVFQYFAIAPMRGLGLKDGLKAAAKADVISLTAFEIGLFGWMALMTYVFFPAPHGLNPGMAAYWFLMQIGMIVGFFTSWPANIWLLNRGIKVAM